MIEISVNKNLNSVERNIILDISIKLENTFFLYFQEKAAVAKRLF